MIIAFSTNLIPKIVYAASMGDPELNNYLNFTLAVFNTKDFQVQPLLGGSQHVNETVCRYTEFRNSPEDPHPYKRPMIYWKILTGRLAFIVIYQVRMVSAIRIQFLANLDFVTTEHYHHAAGHPALGRAGCLGSPAEAHQAGELPAAGAHYRVRETARHETGADGTQWPTEVGR